MDVVYYLAISGILMHFIVILDVITDRTRVARLEITSVLEKLADFLLLIWTLWLYGGLFYSDFKGPWLNVISIRLVYALGIYYCHTLVQIHRQQRRIILRARAMLDD